MRVSERCHQVPIVTVPSESMLGAASRMRWYRVSALPVYHRHRLVGVLSLWDLVAPAAGSAA
jgi:CBS domain-containing protein